MEISFSLMLSNSNVLATLTSNPVMLEGRKLPNIKLHIISEKPLWFEDQARQNEVRSAVPLNGSLCQELINVFFFRDDWY